MAKLVLIQNALYEYFGPMYLSAVLKQHGHQCELFVTQKEKDLIESIKQAKPDIIAFSVMSHDYKWAINQAKAIKSRINVPIMMGGPHPTFFSKTIEHDSVDIICIGEGEYALVELMDLIDKGKDFSNVQNLWVKKGSEIHKNTPRNLIENLDDLPFPDRELYYKRYRFLKEVPTKRFMATRGCPYNCTFCFNHTLKNMYKDKGVYVRMRSPENVIEEIKYIKSKYNLKTVRFSDDTFTLNKKWLLELLELYKKEINLPFTCLCRANEVNDDIVKKLKESGCKSATFGIESGNERIRQEILKKNLRNEDIIKAAGLFRKYKIRFGTYNMMCLPTETIDDAFDTVKINSKIKANFPTCSIFQPYPKTELAEFSIDKGLLDKDFNINNLGTLHTELKIKDYKQISNLHKFFYICVKMPFLIPIVKVLIKLPPNKFFDIIYMLSYAHRSLISFRLGIIDAVKMAINMRKSMMTS
jgi:radical SAM superfamily enzyme YgiQ (UPF0313 family)